MPQAPPLTVPQALLDVFANYGLDIPPLPYNALARLAPVSEELFATDTPPVWLLRNTPVSVSFAELDSLETPPTMAADEREDRDGGADEESALSPAPYFLCGFSGRGLQGRVFLYFYASERLRLGITLPFNCAYADPEQERADLARAMELLEFILLCTREGDNLGTDDPATFLWVNDWNGSLFQVRTGGGEEILHGAGDALFDYLDQRRTVATGEDISKQHWIRV